MLSNVVEHAGAQHHQACPALEPLSSLVARLSGGLPQHHPAVLASLLAKGQLSDACRVLRALLATLQVCPRCPHVLPVCLSICLYVKGQLSDACHMLWGRLALLQLYVGAQATVLQHSRVVSWADTEPNLAPNTTYRQTSDALRKLA